MRIGILWRSVFVVAIFLIVFSVRWDRVAAQVEGLPPNVIVDSGGNWLPAPGYCWASQIEDDYSVVPVGSVVPGLNNVLCAGTGEYSPVGGYCWANEIEDDYSVLPVGSAVPGLSNVVFDGNCVYIPVAGYFWSTPGDPAASGYAVTPTPP